MGTTRNWMWTANLSNSIVGVSVLAMPFCIQQCGLILGLVLLLLSATLTKWSCGLLIRAAQISRRSSYEALALSTFGPLGKNIVEVSIIGLQLGTCIAFYVIIGDLAPPTIARMTGISWNLSTLRTIILCISAIAIVLPLAMLRDIANLSSISVASLSFYACFLFYLLCLALPNVFGGKVWSHLTWWNNDGIFKCMPIFSLAFACHTQLLIIYDQHPDPSLSRMSTITSDAVNLTGSLYALVGLGGYLTYCTDHVEGDVLSNFYPSLMSQLIKLCFALSVVVSFPMMIFPCRLSINSLISQIPLAPLDTPVRIPESKFVPITIFITFATLAIAIILPNIETVLALNGATAGSLISFIFPAAIFLSVTRSREDYRNIAKVIMGIGVLILMVSTVSILVSNMEDTTATKSNGHPWPQPKIPDGFPPTVKDYKDTVDATEDKKGGAVDTHVENYADKLITQAKTSETKQSSIVGPSEQASDSTQAVAATDDHDHKKLISKLEVLEERVEKLESENQELKKESEKLAAQASDSKQDTEKKTSETPVKTNADSNTVKNDETVKLNAKSDNPLSQDQDKNLDIMLHKQTTDNPQLSDVHEMPQKQQLSLGDTKKDTNNLPLMKQQLSKENDIIIDNKNQDVKHEGQGKPNVQTPDANTQLLDLKKVDHNFAPQVDNNPEKNAEHPEEKIPLEKEALKLNPEAGLGQKPEHKIFDDQSEGQTKHSVDNKLENIIEKNLPKLDTGGDVGILSRDLLHSDKHDDDSKSLTDESQVKSDKVDDPQTAVPLATQDKNTTTNDHEPNIGVKREILSVKLTNDNQTHPASDG